MALVNGLIKSKEHISIPLTLTRSHEIKTRTVDAIRVLEVLETFST